MKSIVNKNKALPQIGGAVVFVAMLLINPPDGLSVVAWRVAAVTVLMGIWWITEALPISVTALLPIVLFPVLGTRSIGEATAPYANHLVFLFMGGFILALAMEKWNLHKRIALGIVHRIGVNPNSIVIGFIIAAAFLSMWVSNTATAIMMLPIAMSILALVEHIETEKKRNFELVLLLSIAYACNIGGMGTLIGTPPNALLAGFALENYGYKISFLDWMTVGVPIVLISLPLMYLILSKVVFPIKLKELPGGKELIHHELRNLDRFSNPEIKVAILFALAAFLWMFRPLLSDFIPGLSDAGIAIGISVLLFILPSGQKDGNGLLKWSDTQRLPWGVLILFGGGLSMAGAINASGLADWIGSQIAVLNTWPVLVFIVIIIALIVFLTEMTSNTASTAAFLPILASVAMGLGQNPLLFAIPTALGASCAFMLPVATPPNAIVYGSGKITIPQMSRAGLWLNMLFIILLSIATLTLISYVFGIELNTVPEWAINP